MVLLDQEVRSTAAWRRWTPWVVVGALILALVVGLVVVRYYYRADLFDAYRAGYAAVEADTNPSDGWEDSRCDEPLAAAYPGVVHNWPDLTDSQRAFMIGCTQKIRGLDASPWGLHSVLAYDD